MKNFILFALLIFICACSDKDSSNLSFESLNVESLEQFTPVNYLENNSRVIYKNDDGDQIEFDISSSTEIITDEVIGIKYEREIKRFILFNREDSSYSLDLILTSFYNEDKSVRGLIGCSLLTDKNNGWIPTISLDENGKTRTGFSEDQSLGPKNFADVFSNFGINIPAKHSKIFYNYEFGFVGFHDEDNMLWYLDRYEE